MQRYMSARAAMHAHNATLAASSLQSSTQQQPSAIHSGELSTASLQQSSVSSQPSIARATVTPFSKIRHDVSIKSGSVRSDASSEYIYAGHGLTAVRDPPTKHSVSTAAWSSSQVPTQRMLYTQRTGWH